MVFTKFVEIGRVCFINYGPDYGKLCVVLNVINGSYVLVTGPPSITGIKRQKINLKRLTLTDIVIKIFVDQRDKLVEKAWKEADVDTKWKESAVAKRMERDEKRSKMTDFDRFKVLLAKRERAKLVRAELKAIRNKA